MSGLFARPSYLLWGALAMALAAACHAWGAARRREITRRLLSDDGQRLLPGETPARRRLKAALQLAALALICVALAGPQWGVELVATESRAHQIVIAIDTSLSMAAEDLAPSRLERAKAEMATLLDKLHGHRVGVVAFAGSAALVCPMTIDAEAAGQILAGLAVGLVPQPGTAIGDAIREATAALERYDGDKTLVLLTDGEDHRTDPAGAADRAAAAGVRIVGIGIGTVEGGPIPVRDAAGNLSGYKKDRRGATVISRLGESTLQDAAARTRGAYLRAGPVGDAAERAAELILRGTSGEAVGGHSQRYKNRFQAPLAIAFMLLLLELLIPERGTVFPRQRRSGQTTTASVASFVIVLTASAVAPPLRAATAESSLRRGNRLYEKGNYPGALEAYARAGRKRPDDPRPLFNAGGALYRLEQYERAAAAFDGAARTLGSPALRGAGRFNAGNAAYRQGDYAGAVAQFRQALLENPSDAEARQNLALALRRQKNPPPKQSKPQNDKKQPPQPDKPDPKKGGGGAPPPQPPRPRAQDQLSREDAQRIQRAVAEREKAPAPPAQRLSSQRPRRSDPEEDW